MIIIIFFKESHPKKSLCTKTEQLGPIFTPPAPYIDTDRVIMADYFKPTWNYDSFDNTFSHNKNIA